MISDMRREHPGSVLHALALTAFIAAAAPALPLMAQGLEAEGAIDTIIDAPVATEEKAAGDEEDRIVSAIEKSRENAAEIRKRFSVSELDIVFVPELSAQRALDDKVKENSDAIREVQTAIEGSAIFFHAIDSHQVLLRDVVAVEFGEDDRITIFAAGKDPRN